MCAFLSFGFYLVGFLVGGEFRAIVGRGRRIKVEEELFWGRSGGRGGYVYIDHGVVWPVTPFVCDSGQDDGIGSFCGVCA
jgi:hypothetical protein